MMKMVSLLKAMMSQDMNLFKYKVKGSNNIKKVILILLLSIVFMSAIGSYYFMLAKMLRKIELTFIMLTIALLIPSIFTLIEGIYKSQGILFDAKDNDLLFSLPIKKRTIITARLIKMYIFQFIYNLIFILPALVIYIYLESPAFNFYFLSLIMMALVPIIPTIIACFIGALIKNVSIKFKAKKTVQIILTFALFLGIYFLSLNSNNWLNAIVKNATSINDVITKIYYPIGAYINLIQHFDLLIFMKLLLINFIPLIIFILILNKSYFKTISRTKESSLVNNNTKLKFRKKSIIKALVLKEAKKYFSSPVYIFNTMFGLLLMIIFTIAICVNFKGTMSIMLNLSNKDLVFLVSIVPKVYYCIIILLTFMTSITSSSISIEGKSFNISKSLPISIEKSIAAKIIFSCLIMIPIILICNLIFFINFKVKILDFLAIFLISFIAPFISSCLGLIINLKYPKMNFTSDTEVVKQSMSSIISVLLGILMAMALIGMFFIKINLNYVVWIQLLLLILVSFVLIVILKKYGIKKYREIEI